MTASDDRATTTPAVGATAATGSPASATTIRRGTAHDAGTVAELHSLSWRTAYTGIVPEEALGDGLPAERHEVWSLRLAVDYGEPANTPELLIAEQAGAAVGFAYLVPQPDGRVLLDNLHVRPGRTGGGIGRALLDTARAHVARRHPGADLYLEVLCANTRAVAFYEREGGRRTAQREGVFPGGHVLPEYEYTWPAAG
ncbi:GNAT family N-acetyltransferase [Kitasatospora sp. NPDC088351]|uniref:GNAT family N-acetyltransferase n=1 Tax=unclassified Kitasatospora TaxID=2633591 RepID=UPI003416D305